MAMSKEEALAEVAKRIASCERCKYSPNQNPVPGEGKADAEIMFIGEAPGAKENETGRPFVGQAGQFLEELLNSIGLERQDVFITNIIKYQPPGNRDPLPDEVRLQMPFLLKQIAIIRPKLIIFLGRYAMNALLPDVAQTISQIHGELLWAKDQQTALSDQLLANEADSRKLQSLHRDVVAFLPLFHPASALYKDSMRQILFEDFAKIPEAMDKIADLQKGSK